MHSSYRYPNLREVQQFKPSTIPHLTPYLGTRSRLSQVWFNRWTLLLVLIVVRVFLSTQALDNDINSAEREALSACTSVERAGSALASMPHYMAPGANELSAKAVETSVRALQQALMLGISIIREIVIFYINMLVGTYVCLITFAISGGIGLVLDATEEIGVFINDTLKVITGSITNEVGGFTNDFDQLKEQIENMGNSFGRTITLPELKLPSLDKLNKIAIPTKFLDRIQEMKDNLPDFKDVKDAAENVIRVPFNNIQQQVNNSLSVYQFDRSMFPIPPKEKLTFCSDNNNVSSFFENLKETVGKTKTVIVVVLIVLAVLAIIPMAWLEIRRWRIMRQRANMFSENPNYDPVDITYLASRPSAGTWGLRFASVLKSERRQVLMRWTVAYVTSPPALFVLSLGVAGLISALSQYIVLKQVEKAVPELANQVGGFAGEVVDFLNNSSVKFAASTNNVMQGVSDELNKEVFGWITNGTQSLNDTLTAFSNTMQQGINQYVGGTMLEKPAVEIINCLVGLKIEALQEGLTWVHENAHISFPQIPADIFSIGALGSLNDDKSDSFLADPENASSDMITDTLFKMSKKWQEGLSTEAAISGGVVLIWVFVILIAVIRTGSLWWGLDNVRGDGAPAGVPPPRYVTSRQANSRPEAGLENDDHGMDYPSQTYNRHSGPETFRLGRVSSRRITPPPVAPGGWIDEKKRGHITDDNY
ncbi:hypothetical protein BGX38DRAFT_1249385 [Terfezia claveryi]|nr:hypothetical protein BGX38DRAFT_1249385 [Terfezia claveryi]